MEIYLDNAATSHPKPPEVLKAVREALTAYNGNPGRSGHERALAGARILLSARETLADLMHAPQPECIAFCFNCTDALNTAIKGTLHVGDHVVTSVLEHNSVLRVLESLRRRHLITFTLLSPKPDGMIDPSDFAAALRPNTGLCILTHASNVTGAIQPVAAVGEIMRRSGVPYLIDGAQALGHIPVNIQTLRSDLYAFPGHKGLLGPQGTGGLYVSPELPLNSFREGGTGSSSDSILQPTERPECFESGTVNLPGIAGMKAGAQLIASHQPEHMKHEQELTRALWDGLHSIPSVTLYTPQETACRVPTVSFNIGDQLTSAEAADALAAAHIAVRGGLHCAPGTHQWLGTTRRGAVRVSLNWQNTFEEIDRFLRTVRSLVS